jgi:hypothetical protein
VQREREAIKLHESAAQQLERMAAYLERHALNDTDTLLQEEAMDAAANARDRAEAARARAETVRERLRSEGFDPGG